MDIGTDLRRLERMQVSEIAELNVITLRCYYGLLNRAIDNLSEIKASLDSAIKLKFPDKFEVSNKEASNESDDKIITFITKP